MKRALYLALFLAVVAGLAGGMLSLVNDLTKDKIAEAALSKELVYLEEIFPGANFTQDTAAVAETGDVLDLFIAEGKGKVYKVKSNGYGGEIVFLVGFDTEDKIAGLAVVSHSETPGFGDVIETDTYRNLNVGKKGSEVLDTSSGATVSSNAVNKGIVAAAQHLSGGNLEVEEPEVEISGTTTLTDENIDRYAAEIINKESADGSTVYEVKVEGYGLNDSEYPNPDYKENIFLITLADDTKEITHIEMTQFGDTTGFGDTINNSKYFEKFIGVKSVDDEVDTVSNATKTSYSLFSAIKAVLEDN